MFDAGDEKHHGAENSALKNKAPFSLTPLRISEKASIRFSRESPGDLQSWLESLQTNHLRVAVRATIRDAGAWSSPLIHCTIILVKRTSRNTDQGHSNTPAVIFESPGG